MFSRQNKSVCQKLARSCKNENRPKKRYTPFLHEILQLIWALLLKYSEPSLYRSTRHYFHPFLWSYARPLSLRGRSWVPVGQSLWGQDDISRSINSTTGKLWTSNCESLFSSCVALPSCDCSRFTCFVKILKNFLLKISCSWLVYNKSGCIIRSIDRVLTETLPKITCEGFTREALFFREELFQISISSHFYLLVRLLLEHFHFPLSKPFRNPVYQSETRNNITNS